MTRKEFTVKLMGISEEYADKKCAIELEAILKIMEIRLAQAVTKKEAVEIATELIREKIVAIEKKLGGNENE